MSITPHLAAVSLVLLLSLLVSQQAQGIRLLEKEFVSAAGSGTVLAKDCGHVDDHCSSSSGLGNGRKLITPTSGTDKDKHLHLQGEEKQVATIRQQYSDVIDMTEMDYSPAKRRPPIHN